MLVRKPGPQMSSNEMALAARTHWLPFLATAIFVFFILNFGSFSFNNIRSYSFISGPQQEALDALHSLENNLLDAIHGVDVPFDHFSDEKYNNSRLACNQKMKESNFQWTPEPDKYLVALCSYGRLTNQAYCYRNYLSISAILNRTLIIPHTALPHFYNNTLLVNPELARECLGEGTVISDLEYFEQHPDTQGSLKIEELYCWYKGCKKEGAEGPLAPHHWPQFKVPPSSDWLELKNKPSTEVRPGLPLFQMREDTFLSQLRTRKARVLSMGDVFGVQINFVHLPLVRNFSVCHMTLPLHPAIIRTANGFVRNILGSRFLALHWRRSDFGTTRWVAYSVTQSAECIASKMRRANLTTLYLSTDASDAEVEFLKEKLASLPIGQQGISVTRRLPLDSSSLVAKLPWSAGWAANYLEANQTAIILFDKLVCAMSEVFVGSIGSTFSLDIKQMRKELGKRTCKDEMLCDGQAAWPLELVELPAKV